MIKTALQAALDAGEAILEIYAQDFEVEFKADESPLTAADKAAHNIICEALKSTPYPVLSEESGGIGYEERKEWQTFWLVDPLDGTKEFIKKNDEFTVNIALIDNGVPVMGVVYAPVLHTIYYGVLAAGMEQGAWRFTNCEGKSAEQVVELAAPCSMPHAPCSSPLRVVASRSHCNDETRTFIEALEADYGEVELVSRGSSLKLCMVAEGSADIYPRIAPTMEWDTAAAHAVVVAAGGQVVKYDPAIPAASYLVHSAERMAHGEEPASVSTRPAPCAMPHAPNAMPQTPCPMPHTPNAMPPALSALRYNKQNLLNPYFVVSGLHE